MGTKTQAKHTFVGIDDLQLKVVELATQHCMDYILQPNIVVIENQWYYRNQELCNYAQDMNMEGGSQQQEDTQHDVVRRKLKELIICQIWKNMTNMKTI